MRNETLEYDLFEPEKTDCLRYDNLSYSEFDWMHPVRTDAY